MNAITKIAEGQLDEAYRREEGTGMRNNTCEQSISTTRIRNVEVPMIAHADIKRIPTVEGPVKDEDLGRALEALNDRRLTTPGKVHLYEGEARDLGSVADDGTVILHTRNLRKEINRIAKAHQVPPGRVGRLMYRELLDGFASERLYRFDPDVAKLTTLREENARNARRSNVLPLLAFPANSLSYKPEQRNLVEMPEPTLGLW